MKYNHLITACAVVVLSACSDVDFDSAQSTSNSAQSTTDSAQSTSSSAESSAVNNESTLEALNGMTKNWKEDDERSAIYARITKTMMKGTMSVNSRTRLKVKVFKKDDQRKLVITEDARSGDRWDLEMRFEGGENKPGTYDIIPEGSYIYYTKTVDGETYTCNSKTSVSPTGRIVFTEYDDKILKGTLTFGLAKVEETKSKAGGINVYTGVGFDFSFFNPNINSK